MHAIATTAYDPAEWSDFFVATVGASAALAGLVFVAVSINIDRILALEGIPSRALATLSLLVEVLIVSMVGLAPQQGHDALGAMLLGVSLVGAVAIAVFAARSRPSGAGLAWALTTGLSMNLGSIAMLVGSVSLLAETGGGLYWILAGMALAIVGAVVNAWVLLVEILR